MREAVNKRDSGSSPPLLPPPPRSELSPYESLRRIIDKHGGSESARLFFLLRRIEDWGAPLALDLHGLDDWVKRAADSTLQPQLALLRIVQALPPAAVEQAFGRPLVVWAAIQSVGDSNANDRLFQHLDDMGESSYQLRIAVTAAWKFGPYSRDVRSILQQYELLRACKRGEVPLRPLSESLAEWRRSSAPLSDERCQGYSLTPLAILSDDAMAHGSHLFWEGRVFAHGAGFVRYAIYMDAPSGLLLNFCGAPSALASFFVRRPGELVINQIQGIQGYVCDGKGEDLLGTDGQRRRVKSRALAPLCFEDLLVDQVTALATGMGFDVLGIKPAAQNVWARSRSVGAIPHLRREVAEARYDATAKRMGFLVDSRRDGLWIKRLRG